MLTPQRALSLATMAATLLLGHAAPVLAAQPDDYPNRPMRFIIPYPPGGITDTVGRLVGGKLSQDFNQSVLIDNRPGAGGNIGALAAAKSTPDGYTLFMGFPGTHGINVHIYKNMGYDPIKDFQPITLLIKSPMVLLIHASVPANNLAELVAYAKANPGKLNFGSSGTGGASHFALVSFQIASGVDITHVPYKGTAGVETDIMAGRLSGHFGSEISSMGGVKTGVKKPIAVTSQKRLKNWPGIPALAETYPGFEYGTWLGVLTSRGVPQARVNKLNTGLRKALEDQDVLSSLAKNGVEPAGGTPAQFAAFIAAETKKFAQIVKVAGIKQE
jgi:tripartite-type tricarboxylate transporter receptor subunit TctC